MSMKHILMVASFLIVAFAPAINAQVFEGRNGYRLHVEFVQEPPCPVRIRVSNVTLDTTPEKQHIMLAIDNQSLKPIRAYAMVSGGNRYPTVHTFTFPGSAFEPNQTLLRGVWPNSQEHYYFFFDYILFEDGSTCGYDNHRRSLQIARYLDSSESALNRLRELTSVYPDGHQIVKAVQTYTGGSFSHDMAGPPNEKTIKTSPRRAYEDIVFYLRNLAETRVGINTVKVAREIADRLEKEIPALFPGQGEKQTTRQ